MAATATQDRAPSPSQRWFDNGSVSRLERLPLFGDGMVEVARALTANINTLAATPTEVVFRGVQSAKVEDLIGRRQKGAVFVLAQATGWNTPVALQFDVSVISVMIEVLFGGGENTVEIPNRTVLSPIERRVAELVVRQTADALSAGFADILPSPFAAEPLKDKPDPTLLGKPAAPVLVATLVLRAIGTQAEIDVAVPQLALDAFSDRLSSGPARAGSGTDSGWSEKLGVEVSRARMTLTATLELAEMTLKSVAELRPGQILACPADVGSDVRLSCGNGDLFRCDLGQSNGFYTLRIGDPLGTAQAAPRKDS